MLMKFVSKLLVKSTLNLYSVIFSGKTLYEIVTFISRVIAQFHFQ